MKVEIGDEGELCFKLENGPNPGLFKEYYKDPVKQAQQIHDGYYHCGDTAWVDEDGYVHFVGMTRAVRGSERFSVLGQSSKYPPLR